MKLNVALLSRDAKEIFSSSYPLGWRDFVRICVWEYGSEIWWEWSKSNFVVEDENGGVDNEDELIDGNYFWLCLIKW